MITTTPRNAVHADYDEIARLFPELGVPDRVPSRARFEREMLAKTMVIDAPAGGLAAYAIYSFIGETGYLHHLVVDRAARRRGLGVALMREAARRMIDASCTRMQLSTKPDNHTALSLYRRVGLEIRFHAWSVLLSWSALPTLPASSETLVGVSDPADDAEVERDAELTPGLIAQRRALGGRHFLRATRGGEHAGFAIFDPTFPGTAPFQAASLEDGAALLRAAAPLANPDEPSLFVMIERDEALVRALEAAGGEVKLEIVRLEGPLPLAD